MFNILAQATDWIVGGGGVAVAGWIVVRILKKKAVKILDHPDDKACHVNSEAVNKHLADKSVHVDKEYIELRFGNVEDRLESVHESVKETRTDVKKILERL